MANDTELFNKLADKYHYFNWIPSISGNLYFSLAKISNYGHIDNLYANFCHLPNTAEKNLNHPLATRYIVCTSVKHHTDAKYGKNYQNFNQRYIFIGKTNKKSHLEGRLFVLYSDNNNNHLIKLLSEIHCTNKILEQQSRENKSFKIIEETEIILKNKYESIEYEIDNLEKNILQTDNVEEIQLHSFDFYIHKNGWCFFSQTTKHKLSSDTIEYIDSYNKVPRFYKLASYFVKQFLHSHAHHSKNQDSTTGITDLSIHKNNKDIDKKTNEILKHQLSYIVKEVINVKRNFNFSSLNPVGFVAYAKSLVYSFEGIINKDNINNHIKYLDNLHIDVTQIIKNNSVPVSIINEGWFKAILLWNVPLQILGINFYRQIEKEPWWGNTVCWFDIGNNDTISITIFMLMLLFFSEFIRFVYLSHISKKIIHNRLAKFNVFGVSDYINNYFRSYCSFSCKNNKCSKNKYAIRPKIYNWYKKNTRSVYKNITTIIFVCSIFIYSIFIV